MTGQLDWLRGGIALGFTFLLAVALVAPIGVSTQFVIFDGIVLDRIHPDFITPDPTAASGYASPNAYLNASGGKYAKHVAEPMNYSFVFVIAIVIGAALSRLTGGPQASKPDQTSPAVWRRRFGTAALPRYALAFAAGFVVLYGARLAGGCTSGHMMSGMMQTAVSGYLFSAAAFGAAIPTAMLVYQQRRGR